MSYPNPTQQAAPREASDDIILKIRTITTMLEVLQQLPSQEKKPMELRTRTEKQELRVLGAMATLLVQRFQVTAVSTGGSFGEVALVACAEDSRATSDDPEDSESSLTDAFIATANPRREDPRTSSSRISIIPLKNFDPNVVPLKHVIKKWDTGLSFQEHAQILVTHLCDIARLHETEPGQSAELSTEGSPCDVVEQSLLKYVIAASFRKMYVRISETNIHSANFFDTLMHLNNRWDHFDTNHPPTPKGPPKYSALDEDFLTLIGEPGAPLDNISIPHLLGLATEFRKGMKPVCHLYTRDTYREIHHLLCQLLASYRTHLRMLRDFEKSQGDVAFGNYVLDVAWTGLCLHTMAYGSVLATHFEWMSDIIGGIMQSRPWAKPNDLQEHGDDHRTRLPESESQDDPDSESTHDSELIAVQPYTKLTETTMITTSQSFHGWSRLMVSYFEAYKIVVNHVKERKPTSHSLSLTIVKIPHQGREMMTWSDLAEGPYDTSMSHVDTPTFRFAPSDEPVVESESDAAWAAQLKAITNAEDFRRAIRFIRGIHANFAKSFDDTAPLSTGDRFTGTIHCEAALASLAYARNSEYSPIADEDDIWSNLNISPFIGVSKWCCPVCEDLLDVLQHHRDDENQTHQFLVSGCHRTIYSCTLPPWLPHVVLARMHHRYWHRLLGTLVEVVQLASLDRPNSTGSHAQSTQSSESKKRGWRSAIFNLFRRRP